MKNAGKDLGVMALISGSGAVGLLATLFVLAGIRGPSAAPEQIEVRQQAVEEVSERASVIRLRGSASLGVRAEPIIYIDGVRVDGDRDEALQRLNPDQIDRIEVLKGDAAKELYGSEAQNGVIQIVTKSDGGS